MFGDVEFARAQMAFTLGFHIIFAVLGIGLPVLMVLAERRFMRTGDGQWKGLAKRWSRATAILFAVGAVSGTALSFELGLLWPKFMRDAGPVFGLSFALEGFAFFTEAIFLGVYLYGWDRISQMAHWLSGIAVAVSGAFSGFFVVTANAWMNTPTGFRVEDGRFVDIDPIAAMLNPAALHQVLHMGVAAYTATGFAIAGLHAFYLRRGRDPSFHRKGLALALAMAIVAAPASVMTGHLSADKVAEQQPVKFAAMEGNYEDAECAPIRIGGYADDEANETRYAIEIPCGLSILASGGDPKHNVTGLTSFPADERPPTLIVHTAFDIMVASGLIMLAVAAWGAWTWWRQQAVPTGRRFLKALILCSPLGFIAVETGWIVTEVGRQPWIVYGVMRVEDAVTPMPGLVWPFAMFFVVYLLLAVITWYLLKRQFRPTGEPTEGL